MRLHRISLRDFRGVDSLEVEFSLDGITIIQGPNETGKTSLADAFMLLLEQKDTTNRQSVKDARPVGRDVGPFVEAELTVGPHHLIYRKRWLRARMTELQIDTPHPEQLAGEEAHLRMGQILDEHTDTHLFRALRYQQGSEITQADLEGAESLAQALDAAAGGSSRLGDPAQDTLIHRVEEERDRYFTRAGKPTRARSKKAEALAELREAVTAREQQIRSLEQTIERLREIDRTLTELQARRPHLREQLGRHADAVHALELIESRAQRSLDGREKAEALYREAASAQHRRTELAEEARKAADAATALEAGRELLAPKLAAEREKVQQAEGACKKATSALSAAEEEARLRNQQVELLDLRLDRDRLDERKQQLDSAEATIQQAEQFLEGCALDDDLLARIDRAAEALAVAEGRAQASMPRISIDALAAVEITLNGRRTAAAPGSTLEQTVSDQTEVVVDDLARVIVSAPKAGDAQQSLLAAQRQLHELLKSAGVDSAPAAHALARERTEHESRRSAAVEQRKAALRDLEPAKLRGKLERATQRVAALEADTNRAPADDRLSLDETRALVQHANAAAAEARSVEMRLQGELAAARTKMQEIEKAAVVAETQLDAAREHAARADATLGSERAAAADADIKAALANAESSLAAATVEQEQARQELADADADSTRATLQNAEQLSERLHAEISELEIARAQKQGHLESEGHQGLADKLAVEGAMLEELQREVDAEDRGAAAAELLYRVLADHREQAQRAYVGPFAEKVNAYARILYGPGVEVAIDHRTLAVDTRTLESKTVPFASLSGGAREQLAVIARLACGALVGSNGGGAGGAGVPVIIDDALGYSDPGRLDRLGAALAVAGKDCQVILLTCEPRRYQGVGGAKVVTLERGGQASGAAAKDVPLHPVLV